MAVEITAWATLGVVRSTCLDPATPSASTKQESRFESTSPLMSTRGLGSQRVNGLYKHADDVESCQPASMPPPLIKRTHPKAAPVELVIRMLELYPSGAKNNPHIKK